MDVLIPVWADMMNGDEYKDKTEVERRKLFVRQSRFYKLITGQIKPEEAQCLSLNIVFFAHGLSVVLIASCHCILPIDFTLPS